MKLKIVIFFVSLFLFIIVSPIKAATTSNNLKGRILLQVESRGEAWYVNPKDGKRYYMANGNEAFRIMKTLGIGMSNKDAEKMKKDANFRKQLIGKILLQVESHGEAYYISFDGRYNYLKDGAAAYQIMRKLGLGITNSNLNKIANIDEVLDCGTDLNCFIKAADSCQKVKAELISDVTKIKANYEITGQEGNKCVARIKGVTYKGMGSICEINLTGKIGQSLNNNYINPASTKISFSTASSVVTYDDTLACEGFIKMHDNPKCRLNTNVAGLGAFKGGTQSESISGFVGREDQLLWSLKDTNIITLIPPLNSSKVQFEAVGLGSTELIVTDNAVGSDCFVTIPVTVEEDSNE